jgi:hypothetical protein
MASRSDVLASDEECTYCGVPLPKGTEFYRRHVNGDGEIIYECDRCSAINEVERSELARISALSKKEMDGGISAFEMDHEDMLAMSEMDSSLNGALDFESWMSTAKEVLGSTSSDVKTVKIVPDKDMEDVLSKMKEASFAEMEYAKNEWNEKSKHFLSPSDSDFIYGGIHGPDSMSYQDWRGSSISIPTPRDGVSASEELGHLRTRWLGGGSASGASASGGATGGVVSNLVYSGPPSSGGAAGGAAGGAGRGDDDTPVMSERQRRFLGLN